MSVDLDIRPLRARARAKVNLSLDVLYRRPDGYHEIETILQSVDLFDELDITFDTTGRIRLSCSDPEVPTDEANICWRAVEMLRPVVHDHLGATIRIDKRIPHGAGLGGGSADAAAVILAAHRAARLESPVTDLEPLAARLGSDVPFMLYGGTMLARGRGERLTRLEPVTGGHFVIVKPPIALSTAEVYRKVNLALTRHRYRINLKQVNGLLSRFPNVTLTFRNALEDVVCPSYPVVSELLGELLAEGPRFGAMSGSGSALFAVFGSESKAIRVAERFSVRGFYTVVTAPSRRAVDIEPTEPHSVGPSKGGA